MSLARSVAGVPRTILYAGVAVTWAGLAAGQEEATVAQRPAANSNQQSFQMKPVTAELSNTDAQRINADADQDKLWRDVLSAQSLKRRGEVEDVARAIAFFAGDDSGFVTGQTLLVDGGWMRN